MFDQAKIIRDYWAAAEGPQISQTVNLIFLIAKNCIF